MTRTNRRILYVIDDASRMGGAHIATYALLREFLKRGVRFDVLCETLPKGSDYHGLDAEVSTTGESPEFYAFDIKYHSVRWLVGGVIRRLFKHQVYPNWLLDPFGKIRRLMQKYNTVCVASEQSDFRCLVASLPPQVRKVQLIHTNYEYWAPRNKPFTFKDQELYSRYDAVACVGKVSAEGFKRMYPALAEKVSAFYNVIEFNSIPMKLARGSGPMRFITLARINDVAAKDGPRMIRVVKRLCDAGCKFIWDVYGGIDSEIEQYRKQVNELGLSNCLVLHGFDPDARDKIGAADVMVMLSHYEGLPNVIYESLAAGTPVFSTAVGGISEQIIEGVNGWLVTDDEERIVEGLQGLCLNGIGIGKVEFSYDNDEVVEKHLKLLSN